MGRFTLRPRRQLLDGEAPVAIGRKALDLLSALAEADGALVTKDELMAAVWPNAIVEENAIQVHIAALRKVLGDDAERLSTVRGLGYRLAISSPGAAPSTPTEPAPEPTLPHPDRASRPTGTGRDRKRVAAAGGLIALALALSLVVAGFWRFGLSMQTDPRPRAAIVAVAPFQSHGGARVHDVGEGLVAAIVDALSNARLEVASDVSAHANAAGPHPDSPHADFRLAGTLGEDASGYDVYVHLDDVRRNVVLWSDTFRGAISAPAALQASVAAHLADVAGWASAGRAGRPPLPPSALAAFIAGREATIGVRGDAAALNDYRTVVAAAPNFSWGHSALAVTDGFELAAAPVGPNAPMLIAEARREAERALALDPHNGEAYLALELVAPLDWRRREYLLTQGVAADPTFEPLVMMEGRLLWFVGRDREAAEWLGRAHDLDRLHNGTSWSLAVNLAGQGRSAASRTVLAQMMTQWPEHPATKGARFWTSVASGAADETLALLANPATWPSMMDRVGAEAWRGGMKAIRSDKPADKAVAAAAVVDAAARGSIGHGEAMILLSRLGELDLAFAQAQAFEPGHLFAPAYLSLPLAAAMRADRRFMPLARRLGLVAYWRSTGQWPDFCSEPKLPYDCRVEAGARAIAPPPSAGKVAAHSPPPPLRGPPPPLRG